MSTAVRAIAKLGAAAGLTVWGIENGYDGLLDGRVTALTQQVPGTEGLSVTEACDRAAAGGGTFLGSARSARFRTPQGRAEGAERLRKLGSLGLIVLGGDGSLTGAHLLSQEHGTPVMGIPASIDNDIGFSGMSLGVDTALNTIVDACDKISDTAISHQRAFVVEVMGRNSGYLAMAAGISAGADGVLLPERDRDQEHLVKDVADIIERAVARGKRRVLLLKAEGVAVPCTKLVREVEELLSSRRVNGLEVRATVLGHLVRGGRPSHQDRMIAARLGRAAVEALLGGHTDKMCAWQPTHPTGLATNDPAVALFPIEDVLKESRALLDGTSDVVRWRLAMMHELDHVLGL
jgi:6-phosphofructokinase 1